MKNKITIIGAGMVGSTTAYSLLLRKFTEEIALIDTNNDLVNAQMMDLQHAVPFVSQTRIKVGSYKDCVDSKIAIVICGSAQKPGETRLDLIQKNATIIKKVVGNIFAYNPQIILIMVTNPVDVLTNIAVAMFPDKQKQIIGTGTILDSARFRQLIGEKLTIDPQSIHAYILGEHGDSEFPVWSTASIGGMSLNQCEELSAKDKQQIFEKAKNAAYTIIAGKQSTYYAIGAGCTNLSGAILNNKKSVFPVSHLIKGAFGLKDVCLSMPVVVGQNGIEKELPISLNKEEQTKLIESAKIIQENFKLAN